MTERILNRTILGVRYRRHLARPPSSIRARMTIVFYIAILFAFFSNVAFTTVSDRDELDDSSIAVSKRDIRGSRTPKNDKNAALPSSASGSATHVEGDFLQKCPPCDCERGIGAYRAQHFPSWPEGEGCENRQETFFFVTSMVLLFVLIFIILCIGFARIK